MLYYLYQFSDQFDLLNLFQYQTFRAAGAALTAFLLSVIFGDRLILRLTALKIGQPIRTAAEVHKLAELHGGKGGTPTMGGIMIVGSVVAAALLWAIPSNPFIRALLLVTIGTGFLGFFDDYLKVTRKTSAGVSGRVKLVAQFGIALAAVLYLYAQPGETRSYITQLWVPFLKEPLIEDMGILAVFLLPVVVVGCSNAVNLTDGLDGLATGCTLTTAAAYTVFSYVVGNSVAANYLYLPFHPQAGEVAVFCAALLGAGLGFLWFNCHPARVFMGDTGSLAIGGMLGMIAICCKQEILLIIVGGVFVAEALSVILQVASFKLTGRRIFKMAPLHHHFELMGWKESRVITRFWIASIICALVGVATLKIR